MTREEDRAGREPVGLGVEAGDLLDGPRGRRLLAELAEELAAPDDRWSAAAWWGPAMSLDGAHDLSPGLVDVCLERLGRLLDRVDLSGVASLRDPWSLVGALRASVDAARYWQDPDAADGVLADARARRALEPLAEAVLRAPAAAWWHDGVDLALQHHVDLRLPYGPLPHRPPVLTGGADALRRQDVETTARHARERREHPDDVLAPWSGDWWSSPPDVDGVVETSPGLAAPSTAALLPVGLSLVEDASDDGRAVVTPLRPYPGLRVLEVHDASTWVDLVEAHPWDATWSRGHSWREATGRTGPWVLPDWSSVAREWDGVHLSVLGYLTISGRPLTTAVPRRSGDDAAPGTATFVAFWNPGHTWWLDDALRPAGPVRQWARDDDDRGHALGWSPR